MKLKTKRYQDDIHGFIAEASSKMTAWMLIRNKCHELKLQVPEISQIKEL